MSNTKHQRATQNIYIMGCGRSGTTLMLALMSCYSETYCLIGETGEYHWSSFDDLDVSEKTRVIKRASNAYDSVAEIPESIGILYMVRHPLDVMASTLHYNGEITPYYIPPERWIAEARALKSVVGRPNVYVVSYERLVTAPDLVQINIAERFNLNPKIPFVRFHESFRANDGLDSTMNGVRPPDPNSIDQWRLPGHNEHSKTVWPLIQSEAQWFCRQFGYTVELGC